MDTIIVIILSIQLSVASPEAIDAGLVDTVWKATNVTSVSIIKKLSERDNAALFLSRRKLREMDMLIKRKSKNRYTEAFKKAEEEFDILFEGALRNYYKSFE